jgi:predicted ATP-grasp superfamily ATP-dependent carboligase
VAADLFTGHTSLGAYLKSLNRTRVESVFCRKDIMPSIAELVLLPYLVMKKYVLKEKPKPGIGTPPDSKSVELPISRTG